MRSNLNYNESEWITLIEHYLQADKTANLQFDKFPINYSIQQIERYLKKYEASNRLLEFITCLLHNPVLSSEGNRYYGSDLIKAIKKLNAILSDNGSTTLFKLNTSDIGNLVNTVIASIKTNNDAFNIIFISASDATQSKPTKKFLNLIDEHVKHIGAEVYRKVAHQILSIAVNTNIILEKESHTYKDGETYEWTTGSYLSPQSQQFIKGIIWTMERYSDKETINILSELFEKAYKKIPGQGPAAASLGNACAFILVNMRGKDGLGALSRIKLKLKQNNIKKTIDKYLLEGAKKYKVSVEELKEMAVPDFKMQKGIKTIAFDAYNLNITIEGTKVLQTWFKPDNTVMKSVPRVVKNSVTLSNKLKEVRKEIKEIQKVFSAQKQRIDNQFILDRTWTYNTFSKYYLNHGLVRPIAQKLIWCFRKDKQSTEAILIDDYWQDLQGNHILWIDDETEVKLWHPVNATEDTIIAWREKIMDLEWKQLLKQGFREIYVLTDAEINTVNYSNRMAAHILKQHQFKALASIRGWKYSLMGAYDDGMDNTICEKYLPEYKIKAEYWIDEINDDEAFNDAGIWFYVSTDQVKFKDEKNAVIDLINVPKMVFTEIMRDVDLFVGVCSVGNDPEWADNNGERQVHRDYWQSYSFGDLTEIAKTRKIILERLLPRLKKIRDKTYINGKFLIVKGELRTYKIHIGSGNILMEPNDQYLCIVPSRSVENTTDKIFIPFEGDKGLSILLSKAFLLAEDKKITDTTITSQINRI
ncbi:MAG: DUF4132 domain-containing protein [Flavobacteriaceae bacterium]|nr:DUF4132 domain-containing protein [Flavobacteriaceae bacterium]